MTISTYPGSLPGLKFDRVKSYEFNSRVLTARSGKTQRVMNWPYPKWHFELSYEFLRENVNTEFQTLLGFGLTCYGQAQPFYYQDPYDNTVVGQNIGVGDGTTKTFRLIRAISGFVDLIYYAPTITAVYLNGVSQATPGVWSPSASGNYGNDSVTFVSAPSNTVVVSADFTFNFVCAFMQDKYDFSQMWANFWEAKKIDFQTVF